MQDLSHRPVRPAAGITPAGALWDCAACPGTPWPCEPERARLAGDLDPIALGIYMAGHLYDAAGEIGDLARADLFARFLAWTRGPVPINAAPQAAMAGTRSPNAKRPPTRAG